MSKRRGRERSKTPEVRWELLPADPVQPVKPNDQGRQNIKNSKVAAPLIDEKPKQEEKTDVQIAGEQEEARAKEARVLEKDSWRNLVVLMAALRGDPKIEVLLAEKNPELRDVAKNCGAGSTRSLTLDEAKESAKGWFARGLKGSNRHGPEVRTALCDKLAETLKERVASLQNTETSRAARVLESGPPEEEGPLICSLLSRDLEGSRFDGLWIAREGRGIYRLGDDHEGSGLPSVDTEGARIFRPRVVVKFTKGQLLIDGFYHEGETALNPAKVHIGVFLGVYFEGLSLKEANARWRGGGLEVAAAPPAVTSRDIAGFRSRSPHDRASEESNSLRALAETLPPGWELRESRSKKGVYYYANPSKGLSQLERPRA